jgi:hypothetical protein
MKLLLATLVLVPLAFATTPTQAQNYPWCAQYSGRMGGAMNCGFVSFQQCLNTVSGVGGFCIENNTYHPPAGPHRTYRKKAKQTHHGN